MNNFMHKIYQTMKWKKFLEKYNFPKLTQNETEKLKIPVSNKNIKLLIKSLLIMPSLGQDGLTSKFYQTMKEEMTPVLYNLRI